MFRKIKELSTNLAIYGLGDVATSIVSFLLLPLYVRYLTATDYGVIGLLLTVEVVAKIIFRWGVDGSFMRFYYECHDQPSRQRLASTIFIFLLVVNGTFLSASLAAAPFIAAHLFGGAEYTLALRLVLTNTFVVGFYFIPFHVMRIQGRARQFIALTFSRSTATLLVRLLLVVGFRLGVLGFVLADIIVTTCFTLILARWFAPLIRPIFSKIILVETLRFGLPRLPHGVAHQVIAVADRYLLSIFVTLREVGLYSIGASFGLALKLFLSAFEYAWAPFYFAAMKEPDAKQTYSGITTYGIGMLVLLTAGLAATADSAVRIMTKPDFYEAARVVPWIGIGVLFQGTYLLTSIGLNITKHTEYYPIATAIAAATSIASNLVLIPRFGALGAAWSNTLAYAVLAAMSLWFSQRFYPIRYERGRILRVVLAGMLAYAVARVAVPVSTRPLVALVARGSLVVVTYATVLLVSGFFRATEFERLRRMLDRFRPVRLTEPTPETAEFAGEIVSTTGPDPLDEEPVDTALYETGKES